jgi:hypothetical protein
MTSAIRIRVNISDQSIHRVGCSVDISGNSVIVSDHSVHRSSRSVFLSGTAALLSIHFHPLALYLNILLFVQIHLYEETVFKH